VATFEEHSIGSEEVAVREHQPVAAAKARGVTPGKFSLHLFGWKGEGARVQVIVILRLRQVFLLYLPI